MFNIFSELARRLIPPGSAKTTLLPNEQWTRTSDGLKHGESSAMQ